MDDGWHIRIPVAVTNPLQRDLRDVSVGYDLALREVLLAAGWARSRTPAGSELSAFELDPRSVRVVEYHAIGVQDPRTGRVLQEVASRARLGLLESSGIFDARRDPALHVEWALPGTSPAGGTRYFMIYLDSTSNGVKPEAAYPEEQRAPIDARHWVSRGTVLYGMAERLVVVALEPETRVTMQVSHTGNLAPFPLGFEEGAEGVVLDRGEVFVALVAEKPTVVRVDASRPVIVMGVTKDSTPAANAFPMSNDMARVSGFIPSADGGVLGTQFTFVPAMPTYTAITMGGAAAITIRAANQDSNFYRVGPAAPAVVIPVPNAIAGTEAGYMSPPHFVTSTDPILLLASPTADGFTQFASAFGAPAGSTLVGYPFPGVQCLNPNRAGQNGCRGTGADRCEIGRVPLLPANGEVRVVTLGGPAYVRGRELMTSDLTLPIGRNDKPSATSGLVPPGGLWTSPAAASPNFKCPTWMHVTKDATSQEWDASAGAIAAFGGNRNENEGVGPVGGLNATRFVLSWPVDLVAFYPRTDVRVEPEKGDPRSVTLGEGGIHRVEATLDNPVVVTSSKPMTALSATVGGFFAGLDKSMQVRPLPGADFRGYLLDLEPAGGGAEPMVGVAGPGKTITYRFRVENLAKDHLGTPVEDSVQISLPPPPEGWTVEAPEEPLALSPGGGADFAVKVTAPLDAPEGARLSFAVTAASLGNPLVKDDVQVTSLVRATYGVEIAFDRAGGPKVKTISMEPDSAVDAKLFVRNLATVQDRLIVSAIALSSEWQTLLGPDLEDELEVVLEPNETREIPLRIQPPPGNASQTFVEVRATSVTSASAADKVSAMARVRGEVRITLDVEEGVLEVPPGSNATFRVLFRNQGTDSVSLRFNATAALPAGWQPPVVMYGEHRLDELAGVLPGASIPLNVTAHVPTFANRSDRATLQFVLQTLPQFAGDRVLRDSVDLLALVGVRHSLAPTNADQVVRVSLDGEATAQLVLENRGNLEESVRIEPLVVPRGVSGLAQGDSSIPMGGQGELSYRMNVDGSVPAGSFPVRLTIRASDGHAVPWNFSLVVPERRLAEFSALAPNVSVGGVERTGSLRVRNSGNSDLPLPPLLALPSGWSIEWGASARPTLGPEESTLLQFKLTAPPGENGRVRIPVDPLWAVAPPLEWEVQSIALEFVGVPIASGDGVVTARIENRGTGEARNVTVKLERAGQVLDTVHIERLSPGASAMALLSDPEGGEASVVIDAAGVDAKSTLRSAVSITANHPVPQPSTIAAVALLVAAARGLLRGARRH